MRLVPALLTAALVLVSASPAGAQSGPPEPTEAVQPGDTPDECRPAARLSMAGLADVTQPAIDALWSYYETGDETAITALATPRGLERLMEVDWRSAAVERGDALFREVPEIIDFNDWQEWCIDGSQVVALDVEPIIRIDPGARTIDAASRIPIEAAKGEQLRALGLRFTRASDAEPWLIDDVGVSQFRPRYVQPREPRPCPGLRDPSSVADPFLLEPWCSANGDGRRIPTRGAAAELGVGRAACLAGAHEIAIGLPPGTPLRSFDDSRFYIRDPGGKARKALGRAFSPPGFRRDFRPPSDAISTGITNGYATIWTSEKLGDEWLLVQVGDRFERWPRSIGGCGPA